MNGRRDRLAFLNGTAFEWLLAVLVPDNPFENPAHQDALIAEVPDPTGLDPEDYRLHYRKLCLAHGLRGRPLARADVPALVIRAVTLERFVLAVEAQIGHTFDTKATGRYQTGPFDGPRWVNCAELLQELVGSVPALCLSDPQWSRVVFVTFRETDDVAGGHPVLGLVEDVVHEANHTLLGTVAERIDHHLALGYDKITVMVLYCYGSDNYNEFRIPVAPDAQDHKFFRPVDPADCPTCGTTHPELTPGGPCALCPACAENELVHSNDPLSPTKMWMAFVKGPT